jgi:CrcB protein
MNALWVFLGGGLGSLIRFGISRLSARLELNQSGFPWATFLANVLACVIMSWVIIFIAKVGGDNERIRLFALVGLCGGLSTFSTFSLENYQLIQNGQIGLALVNILANTIACLLVFFWAAKQSGTHWVV